MKLKWHYNKKYKQWYVSESVSYANDGFSILKIESKYILLCDGNYSAMYFNKLSSAKKVAELLRNG